MKDTAVGINKSFESEHIRHFSSPLTFLIATYFSTTPYYNARKDDGRSGESFPFGVARPNSI